MGCESSFTLSGFWKAATSKTGGRQARSAWVALRRIGDRKLMDHLRCRSGPQTRAGLLGDLTLHLAGSAAGLCQAVFDPGPQGSLKGGCAVHKVRPPGHRLAEYRRWWRRDGKVEDFDADRILGTPSPRVQSRPPLRFLWRCGGRREGDGVAGHGRKGPLRVLGAVLPGVSAKTASTMRCVPV